MHINAIIITSSNYISYILFFFRLSSHNQIVKDGIRRLYQSNICRGQWKTVTNFQRTTFKLMRFWRNFAKSQNFQRKYQLIIVFIHLLTLVDTVLYQTVRVFIKHLSLNELVESNIYNGWIFEFLFIILMWLVYIHFTAQGPITTCVLNFFMLTKKNCTKFLLNFRSNLHWRLNWSLIERDLIIWYYFKPLLETKYAS